MAAKPFAPFTAKEHATFVSALEKNGESPTVETWTRIAEDLGNGRTAQDVMIHATDYLLRLQSAVGAAGTHADELSLCDGTGWTAQEDKFFESCLSSFEEADPARWEKIARLMPGRTTEQVRARYQRLVLDVARIEAGETVTMLYKNRVPQASTSSTARAADSSSVVHRPPTSASDAMNGVQQEEGRQ